MPTYYVHIPASDMPTAEVDASSTKHARTAYLDYLTRGGRFPYSQRGAMRKVIKVNRMQPGEIQTTAKLEYGVKEPPVQEIETAPTIVGSESLQPWEPQSAEEVDRYYQEGRIPEGIPLREDQRQLQQPTQPFDVFGSSPVVQLSRKSRGV